MEIMKGHKLNLGVLKCLLTSTLSQSIACILCMLMRINVEDIYREEEEVSLKCIKNGLVEFLVVLFAIFLLIYGSNQGIENFFRRGDLMRFGGLCR